MSEVSQQISGNEEVFNQWKLQKEEEGNVTFLGNYANSSSPPPWLSLFLL